MRIKVLKYSGIAGGMTYWLFTFWAISKNNWFSFLNTRSVILGQEKLTHLGFTIMG